MARKTKNTKPTTHKHRKPSKQAPTKRAVRKPSIEEIVEQDGEAEETEEGKGSVIKPKYRQLYRPHQGRNGDEFSFEFSEAVTRLDDKGKPRIDTEKLREIAEANGVWQDRYADLNPGMQRMNVGNRLRAKLRKGEEIQI